MLTVSALLIIIRYDRFMRFFCPDEVMRGTRATPTYSYGAVVHLQRVTKSNEACMTSEHICIGWRKLL